MRKHHDTTPPTAQRAADAILARPDYYAGQIAGEARECIREEKAHALGSHAAHVHVRATGHIQAAVLEHSIAVHKKRADAVPAGHDLIDFLKAMWANQNAARKAASDAKRRQNRHGLAAGLGPVAPTTPAGAHGSLALATIVRVTGSQDPSV